MVTPRCALFLVNRFCDKGLNTRPFQATDKDIVFMYIRPTSSLKRPIFKAIMPIFRAEIAEKVEFSFDPILLFEPGEVFTRPLRERNMAYYYIFFLHFLFRVFTSSQRTEKMGKAYSLPSCPDQLAVSFWIPDPVTYHVLSYPE